MKRLAWLPVLILSLGCTFAALWLLTGNLPFLQADSPHHVALNCTGVPAPCHTSLQAAVDAAVTGDVILVAGGTYTGVQSRPRPAGYVASPSMTTITQVVLIDKAVTIRGGYTTAFAAPPDPIANPTTLNAEGKGRVLVIAGYISPTIEGLRLTGGNSVGQQGETSVSDASGGVYVISATATLSNNQIISNTAYSGGGVYLMYSDARLDNNTLIYNTGGPGGGGALKSLYSDNAVLQSNFVATNTARSGGGLFVNYSNATLSDNTIVSNTATTGLGGGLLLQTSRAVIDRNRIISNTAKTQGGGMYVYADQGSTLSNNVISANRADASGGVELYSSAATLISNTISTNIGSSAALVLYYSNAALSDNLIISNTSGCGLFLRQSNAALTNTVVTDNRAVTSGGCGLYLADGSLPILVHTTIARNGGNDGMGVHVSAYSGDPVTATMTNTILISHTWGIYIAPGDAALLESTLWGNENERYGTTGTLITGTHNYWGNPHLAADGYHLLSGSAAIDRGVNAGVTGDIDGEPRIGLPDLGADEFIASNWRYLYLPIVLRN